MVHWVDVVVVAVYLLLTLALGLVLTRRVKSAHDFFLAGRNLPFWAIGMSLVVSDIGALEMVGGTAGAYEYGAAQANYEWVGCIPAMVIGGLVFIPIYWRSGVYSVPEYLGKRYGPPVHAIQAVVWALFLGVSLGIFFQASAEMLAGVLGWPQWVSIGVTAVVVAVYTVGGGLSAVVVTDVIQCVVLFVGGLTLSAIGLAQVGGLSGLAEGLGRAGPSAQHHLELLMPVDLRDAKGEPTGYPWTGILLGLGLVLSPAYWLGNQAIVQRTLAARDEWSARASVVFGAVLKTVVPLAFVLPGLLGVVLLRGREGIEPNGVYSTLVRELLPVGLRGVLYAAFLAALMSTVDSYTNSAATILSRDLYRRFIVRDREDRHYLLVGRICSFAIIALGVASVPVVALHRTIYDAFQTYLAFFQGPTLALLVGGLLWRRATPIGGLAALLVGLGATTLMHLSLDLHYLHTAFWSFCLSLLVLVVVSLLTRPLPEEELVRLVFVSRRKGRSV